MERWLSRGPPLRVYVGPVFVWGRIPQVGAEFFWLGRTWGGLLWSVDHSAPGIPVEGMRYSSNWYRLQSYLVIRSHPRTGSLRLIRISQFCIFDSIKNRTRGGGRGLWAGDHTRRGLIDRYDCRVEEHKRGNAAREEATAAGRDAHQQNVYHVPSLTSPRSLSVFLSVSLSQGYTTWARSLWSVPLAILNGLEILICRRKGRETR